MAVIEHPVARKGSFLSLLLGRVFPHTAIVAFLLYFLTKQISTLHQELWLVTALYGLFTLLHSVTAYKRVRFRYVLVGSLALAVVMWFIANAITIDTEAGSFYAVFVSSFIVGLFLFSTVNNFWFFTSRIYYIAELVFLNAAWLVIIVTGIEAPIEEAIGLSLPLVAYSLYILLFDYAFMQPLRPSDKARLFVKYAAVVLILILATLFGFLSGISKSQKDIKHSYSLMSSQGGMYTMDERAKMEEDFRIPLDSKELVFIANIDPVLLYGRRENIGYYLKFHSLYNYDPVAAEFNSQSDEMEDPYFFIRQVDITNEKNTPRHLAVDLAGKNIVPPYALRTEGAATIYNVKLDTKQSFSNNITYRFIAYPSKDSIMIGDEVQPIQGVYKLFNRISMLNIIPVGTSGQFFDFDYNKIILDRAENYYNPEGIPQQFVQQYLNYTGLERDIVDSMKSLLKSKNTLSEKVQTVFDFFTARDENGNQVFTYDLHPGKSPNPDESMLHYFLMTNRKGYCTYYATAAALFFRVAGIPARVAIGFVPGETSKKNPGWYYVYSQQGHAWTEIYLGPNLGWLDVDLTPAGDNETGPPPPDSSPPTPPIPPKPVYVLRGVVQSPKPLIVAPISLMRRTEQQDEEICTSFAYPLVRCEFDEPYGNKEVAKVLLSIVQPGDTVVAIGREDTNPGVFACDFEVFNWYSLRRIQKRDRDSLAAKDNQQAGGGFHLPLWVYILAAVVLLVLMHSIPSIHLWRLRMKAISMNDDRARLFVARRWLFIMLHINGYPTRNETDREYALRLAERPGVNMNEFVSNYYLARYSEESGDGSKDVALQTMYGAAAAIRKHRNIAERFWARIHLWEYFRIINQGKA